MKYYVSVGKEIWGYVYPPDTKAIPTNIPGVCIGEYRNVVLEIEAPYLLANRQTEQVMELVNAHPAVVMVETKIANDYKIIGDLMNELKLSKNPELAEELESEIKKLNSFKRMKARLNHTVMYAGDYVYIFCPKDRDSSWDIDTIRLWKSGYSYHGVGICTKSGEPKSIEYWENIIIPQFANEIPCSRKRAGEILAEHDYVLTRKYIERERNSRVQ